MSPVQKYHLTMSSFKQGETYSPARGHGSKARPTENTPFRLFGVPKIPAAMLDPGMPE